MTGRLAHGVRVSVLVLELLDPSRRSSSIVYGPSGLSLLRNSALYILQRGWAGSHGCRDVDIEQQPRKTTRETSPSPPPLPGASLHSHCSSPSSSFTRSNNLRVALRLVPRSLVCTLLAYLSLSLTSLSPFRACARSDVTHTRHTKNNVVRRAKQKAKQIANSK